MLQVGHPYAATVVGGAAQLLAECATPSPPQSAACLRCPCGTPQCSTRLDCTTRAVCGPILERTSVRDRRLLGQTFTPVREVGRRDSVRLRNGLIDLAPDEIGVRLRPRLQAARERSEHRRPPSQTTTSGTRSDSGTLTAPNCAMDQFGDISILVRRFSNCRRVGVLFQRTHRDWPGSRGRRNTSSLV